jgi:hypothetical protein
MFTKATYNIFVMHKRLKGTRLCITSVFPLAACDAQAASVNNLQFMKHFVLCTLKLRLEILI